MTTITNDQLIQAPRSTRSLRSAVGGFLAGAALASAAFVGVNTLSDSHTTSPAVQVNAPAAVQPAVPTAPSETAPASSRFAPSHYGETGPLPATDTSSLTQIDRCRSDQPC